MVQSYTNPGGSGNRTASVTITTTVTIVNGAVSILIDGTQSNLIWFTAGESGKELKLDFGAPRLITEAKWYQDLIATHGTWQWQGSPDNAAWTSIGGTFTLGSPATQTITTLSGNVTSYRYYRMLQTAGTTSSANYVREIEFLIDDGVVAVSTANVTQVSAEHWMTTSPAAQATQVMLEHWMSVASGAGGPQVTIIQ